MLKEPLILRNSKMLYKHLRNLRQETAVLTRAQPMVNATGPKFPLDRLLSSRLAFGDPHSHSELSALSLVNVGRPSLEDSHAPEPPHDEMRFEGGRGTRAT